MSDPEDLTPEELAELRKVPGCDPPRSGSNLGHRLAVNHGMHCNACLSLLARARDAQQRRNEMALMQKQIEEIQMLAAKKPPEPSRDDALGYKRGSDA